MKKKLLFFANSLLIIFIFLTILTGVGSFNVIDVNATLILQSILPRVLDLPFSLLSLFGSLESVSIVLLLILFFLRKSRYIYTLLLFGVFHVLEYLGKLFVTHPGPTKEFFRYYFNFSLPSSFVKPGSSFPSGHLGRTMFLSVLIISIIYSSKLSIRNKQLLSGLIVVIDVFMFTSRIYLGEHWLSDVLGGSILGTAMGLFSLALL
jgi:membrane-associated phospholipid phosphatase